MLRGSRGASLTLTNFDVGCVKVQLSISVSLDIRFMNKLQKPLRYRTLTEVVPLVFDTSTFTDVLVR